MKYCIRICQDPEWNTWPKCQDQFDEINEDFRIQDICVTCTLPVIFIDERISETSILEQ